MAHISRTGALGQVATRQDLFDLIETARLKDITESDLSFTWADAGVILTSTEPPSNLMHGALWFDTYFNVFRVFDSRVSYALAIGPDMFDFAARAAVDIPQGRIVQFNVSLTAANWSAEGLPWVQPIGTSSDLSYVGPEIAASIIGGAQNTAVSGGYVAVTYLGFGYGAIVPVGSIGCSPCSVCWSAYPAGFVERAWSGSWRMYGPVLCDSNGASLTFMYYCPPAYTLYLV